MKKKFLLANLLCILSSVIIFSSCTSVKITSVPGKLYVDYALTPEELISTGDYELYDAQINSLNFSDEKSAGKDTLEVALVDFNKRHISYRYAAKWMRKNGMRPATLKEMQYFVEAVPDSSIHDPFVAIGSVSHTITSAPTVVINSIIHAKKGFVPVWGEGVTVPGRCARNLTLEPLEKGTGNPFQFLAVKIK